jgi:MSHA biogenesis protein MshG
MQIYLYKGRNQLGEVLSGEIDSPNAQAVAKWLTDASIYPISIQPKPQPKETPPWLAKLIGEDRIKDEDVLLFTRQMGSMGRSGLPLMQAIDGLQKTTPCKGLAKVLRTVRQDLDKGASLSQAMARHPTVFSEYYVSMITVGENAGQLDDAFQSLQKQLEFDRQMRQRIKTATRYPSFVMVAILIAMGVMTGFVIPAFAQTYASLKVELPLLTRVLLAISDFVVNYWWVALGSVAVMVMLVRAFLRGNEGRYIWDKHKIRLPVFGSIIEKATVARFCGSFATAYRSGVPIVQSLDLVSRVVDNAFYASRIQMMRKGLERGESLSRVARSAGIFKAMELQMIGVGEESGDVEGMVGQIAQMHEEDVTYQVGRLSDAIEPILLGIMGVLVGILLLGIFMPMWSLGEAMFQSQG